LKFGIGGCGKKWRSNHIPSPSEDMSQVSAEIDHVRPSWPHHGRSASGSTQKSSFIVGLPAAQLNTFATRWSAGFHDANATTHTITISPTGMNESSAHAHDIPTLLSKRKAGIITKNPITIEGTRKSESGEATM
jgi:hypothetical protein